MGNALVSEAQSYIRHNGPNARECLLQDRKLPRLPSTVFDLSSLTTLNISRNEISELEDHFDRLQALTSFFANTNRLHSLPPSFSALQHLRLISLQRNQLREVPEPLMHLVTLNELELQENNITKIPDAISSLTNLKLLSITKNEVSELPASLCSMSLTALNAGQNSIAKLPEGISQLKSLRFLVLSSNRFTKVGDEIVHLQQLDTVMFDNNAVAEVHENVTQMGSLSLLELRMNPPLLDVPRSFHSTPFIYCDVPSPVLDNLYLGNLGCSENLQILHRLKITHILRVIDRAAQPEIPFPGQFEYHTIEADDSDKQELDCFFDGAFRYLSNPKAMYLVHCRVGKSRSASVVLAFLIRSFGWSYSHALRFLQEKRRMVQPNFNFAEQLKRYASKHSKEPEDPEDAKDGAKHEDL